MITTSKRPEARRIKSADLKSDQYQRTGFRDRAVYRQFALPTRSGTRHNGGYTEAELHQRAVERRDINRMVDKMTRDRVDAGKAADKARKQETRRKRLALYLEGCRRPQPAKFMHSSARNRAEFAMQLAALPLNPPRGTALCPH
jgi:hypothetical protein